MIETTNQEKLDKILENRIALRGGVLIPGCHCTQRVPETKRGGTCQIKIQTAHRTVEFLSRQVLYSIVTSAKEIEAIR